MKEEEIKNAINNRFNSIKKDGFYISSIDTIAEHTNSVDETKTNIHYTITFEKIQKKRLKRILNKEEKEYLEHYLRPFKDRVKGINKTCMGNKEFISIYLISEPAITLPFFEIGKYYKGMNLDEEYTPDELGLFKE